MFIRVQWVMLIWQQQGRVTPRAAAFTAKLASGEPGASVVPVALRREAAQWLTHRVIVMDHGCVCFYSGVQTGREGIDPWVWHRTSSRAAVGSFACNWVALRLHCKPNKPLTSLSQVRST